MQEGQAPHQEDVAVLMQQARECYLTRGDWPRVIELCDRASAINPYSDEAFCFRGMAKRMLNDYSNAIIDLDRAIELNPNNFIAFCYRGRTKKQQASIEDANPDFEKAIQLCQSLTRENYEACWILGLITSERSDPPNVIIEWYTRAIELNPNFATAYNNRGIAHQAQGNLQQALADYDHALRLNPDHVDAYINRGIAHYDQKHYDLALADYDHALRLNPDYALAYINRGNAHKAQGNLQQALADYDHAIALNPQDAIVYRNRGIAHYDQKHYDLALADYDHAIALNPQDAIVYRNRGIAHYDQKHYDLALADYDHAIALNPQDAIVYRNRGNAHKAQGNFEQAIADFNQVIQLNPNDDIAYHNRALCHSAKGHYDLAIADYTHAIRLNPNCAITFRARGVTHSNKGKYDLAIADYTEAIRLEPDNVRNYHILGDAYTKQENYENAIANYSKAIQLDFNKFAIHTLQQSSYWIPIPMGCHKALERHPECPDVYFVQGVNCIRKREFQRAIANLSQYMETTPNSSQAYAYRGSAHHCLSQHEQAISDYTKAIFLDNSRASFYLNRGIIHTTMKNYADANVDYNMAISLDSDCQRAYLERGKLYSSLGRHLSAISDFNHIIQVKPGNREALRQRAHTYHMLNYYNLAIKDYNFLLKNDSGFSYYYGGNADDHKNRCNVYIALNQYDKACSDFISAIEKSGFHSATDLSEHQTTNLTLHHCNLALRKNSRHIKVYIARGYIYINKKEYWLAWIDMQSALIFEPENSFAKKCLIGIRKALGYPSDATSFERMYLNFLISQVEHRRQQTRNPQPLILDYTFSHHPPSQLLKFMRALRTQASHTLIHLNQLILSNNSITFDLMESLVPLLVKTTDQLAYLRPVLPHLTKLDLSHNVLGIIGLQKLLEGIRGNRTLHVLKLEGNLPTLKVKYNELYESLKANSKEEFEQWYPSILKVYELLLQLHHACVEHPTLRYCSFDGVCSYDYLIPKTARFKLFGATAKSLQTLTRLRTQLGLPQESADEQEFAPFRDSAVTAEDIPEAHHKYFPGYDTPKYKNQLEDRLWVWRRPLSPLQRRIDDAIAKTPDCAREVLPYVATLAQQCDPNIRVLNPCVVNHALPLTHPIHALTQETADSQPIANDSTLTACLAEALKSLITDERVTTRVPHEPIPESHPSERQARNTEDAAASPADELERRRQAIIDMLQHPDLYILIPGDRDPHIKLLKHKRSGETRVQLKVRPDGLFFYRSSQYHRLGDVQLLDTFDDVAGRESASSATAPSTEDRSQASPEPEPSASASPEPEPASADAAPKSSHHSETLWLPLGFTTDDTTYWISVILSTEHNPTLGEYVHIKFVDPLGSICREVTNVNLKNKFRTSGQAAASSQQSDSTSSDLAYEDSAGKAEADAASIPDTPELATSAEPLPIDESGIQPGVYRVHRFDRRVTFQVGSVRGTVSFPFSL